jgi:hypothetical protein
MTARTTPNQDDELARRKRIRNATPFELSGWIAAELTMRGEPSEARVSTFGHARVLLSNRQRYANWKPDAARVCLRELMALPRKEASVDMLIRAGVPTDCFAS